MERVLEFGRVLPAGDPVTITDGAAALGATIRAVAAGDQDAFARLYADYARLVHAILLGRIPRRDVDDLVQEVFLIVFRRIRELRDPAAFGGWIATIARNRATDHMRQMREQVELPANLAGGDPIETEAFAVLEIVRGLPEAYRDTLLIRLVEGMSGNEIAERSGLTPASVRGTTADEAVARQAGWSSRGTLARRGTADPVPLRRCMPTITSGWKTTPTPISCGNRANARDFAGRAAARERRSRTVEGDGPRAVSGTGAGHAPRLAMLMARPRPLRRGRRRGKWPPSSARLASARAC